MRSSVLYIASVLVAIDAFTITSPSNGEILDPTEPITFSWTSDSSDPATFDIVLDNSNSGGLTRNVKVATGVSTSTGSYILSTESAGTYGTGFVLRADSSAGEVLDTSPTFSLAQGLGTTPTYTGSVSEGPASITEAASSSITTTDDTTATVIATTTDNSLLSDDTTTTNTGSAQATLGGNSDSSTTTSMTSATGSNSFTTSTVSRGGSSTSTSSSSSPSATTSQNAQPKLGNKSQMAFTAAGLIAGLAALLA